MSEHRQLHKQESIQSDEKEYRLSPDLLAAEDLTIPAWQDGTPGTHHTILYVPDRRIGQYTHAHTRSRIAQAGGACTAFMPLSENELFVRLQNYSSRPIAIPCGAGVISLYRPSPPARGLDLINAVRQHIDVDWEDIVFADIDGNTFSPQQLSHTMTYVPETLTYLGIRLNREAFFEVNPDQKQTVIGAQTDVRHDATSKLRPVVGQTQTPFAVTTTVPIAVNGTYLTLVQGMYGNLEHLPSLVIERSRSQWNTVGDHNSGIRFEFISQSNQMLTAEELPEYGLVEVQPVNNQY